MYIKKREKMKKKTMMGIIIVVEETDEVEFVAGVAVEGHIL